LTPEINETAFHSANWSEFYGDVQEEMPLKMPKVRGNLVTISAFVDANHAGNVMNRQSHTGIILYVQNAPIVWYSKRQNMVEVAMFGSKFVALRTWKELIVAMHYKLRMFGVLIDGPVNVFCDNHGVVKNASIPESTIMKKHNAINYHVVREAVAGGRYCESQKGGQENKFGRYIDEGDCGTEEMGLLFFIYFVEVVQQPRVLTDDLHCWMNLQGLTKELMAL
jgi:hypothetical protein